MLQPQPQYSVRQVFGVQQQMVGPRGQIATRPMAPGNTQNQQFEDVSNYDFLGWVLKEHLRVFFLTLLY